MVDRDPEWRNQAFYDHRVRLRRAFQVLRDIGTIDVRHPEVPVAIDSTERWGIDPLGYYLRRFCLTGRVFRNPAIEVGDVERPLAIQAHTSWLFEAGRNGSYRTRVFRAGRIHFYVMVISVITDV